MARISVEETAKRRTFAFNEWKQNPKLSIPKINELIKKQFKGMVNTQTLYGWRNEYWKENGILPAERKQVEQNKNLKGRTKGKKPELPPKPIGMPAVGTVHHAAARDPGAPASPFETTVIPIQNEGEAELLQRAFDQLKHQGFLDCRIVDFTSQFAIVSRS